MQINHLYFGGNLTAKPELKVLPSGVPVVQFSIASNRKWKDKNGVEKEEVEFGNCVIFGKQAEVFSQYAVKGQTFLIEGRIQTRNWDDKDTGKKMYRTEIIVERFHFGQKPKGAEDNRQENNTADWGMDFATPPEPKKKSKIEENLGSIDYGEPINPDDIPF